MLKINESGMIFEFYDEDVFQVEKSDLYKSLGEKIKTVEFVVRVKEDDIAFVEAKSSSPNPENEMDFDTYVNEIIAKFIDSFNLYLTLLMKRNTSDDMSKSLREMVLEKVDFKYIY